MHFQKTHFMPILKRFRNIDFGYLYVPRSNCLLDFGQRWIPAEPLSQIHGCAEFVCILDLEYLLDPSLPHLRRCSFSEDVEVRIAICGMYRFAQSIVISSRHPASFEHRVMAYVHPFSFPHTTEVRLYVIQWSRFAASLEVAIEEQTWCPWHLSHERVLVDA